ncbi:MAG: N-terminal double-transrane protein [Planctomycetota bacterium]|nr:N-terminal double-transrane protein [Planctomycetota bacterium]
MLPPLLFAAVFANPFLLWGLAGASLPIIIHLLNKRKFREERWAAMRFLMAAMRKNQKRVKVEQWLLLAVRTLIIILVAMAMAKPLLESLGVIDILRGQRRHWVLVLDGSMSMDYRPNDTPRFDQAKDIARRLVKDARQGDALSLVVMGDPPKVIIGAPAFNKEQVLSELDAVTLPHGGTDLTATFRKIDEVLEASTIPRKEVVFLTDLQTASWRRPNLKGNDDGLKTILAKLEAKKAQSQVIDLGAPGGKNRAVIDLTLDPPIVTMNTPVVAKATIKNFSRDPSGTFTVQLFLGDQHADERTMSLGAGAVETIAIPFKFTSPGTTPVIVKLPDDALRIDDSRRVVASVREAINVLIVDGDPKREVFRSESDFLVQALSPDADAAPSATSDPENPPSAIKTQVVPESQLARQDLAPFDAVVLCNVASVSEAEVRALDSYLKQGGGVIVFGGDRVQADNYNRWLFADGKGILPAKIGAIVGDPAKSEAAFTFDPLGFKHPLVADFAGQSAGVQASLTGVKTFRFHKLTRPKDSAAKVAIAFAENSDPAVIEAPRHRGRVIQVATSADRDWTSWPLHQSYPPVMEQMILLAASGRFEERNVRVGQPLSQSFPPTAAGADVLVKRPGTGPVANTKLKAAGDVSQLLYEETDRSGVYSVDVGPPPPFKTAFAANPDPIESDPEKLDQAGLKAAVPGWKFLYDSDWRGLDKSAASVGQRGEFHRPMLWAVLILLIVESLLAWRFGHHR